MNMWRPVKKRTLDADAETNVRRIDAMWSDCRARYGGPFLFGAFTAADAMYAPVVSRFHTYDDRSRSNVSGVHGGNHGIAGLAGMARRRSQ